jgi:cardiolipin synthase
VKRVALRKRRTTAQVRKSFGLEGARRDADCESADSLIDLSAAITGLPPTAGNAVRAALGRQPDLRAHRGRDEGGEALHLAEYYIIRNDETGRRFLALLHQKARDGRRGAADLRRRRLDGHQHRFLREIVAAGGHWPRLPADEPAAAAALAPPPQPPQGDRGRRRPRLHRRHEHGRRVLEPPLRPLEGAARPSADAHLEIRGPAVQALAQAFIEDWAFGCGETLPKVAAAPPAGARGALVAIVASGPDQEFNASGMVHFAGIAAARRRVYLTSPYFIPDDATVSALVSAALRRVDVRLLVPAPEKSDAKLAAFAARSYYGKLLRGGVRIFEYEAAMLHAKTFVVDGMIAFVGSANVDIRSFRLNFEVGALVSDAAFVDGLEKRFVRDLAHSREITLEELARIRKWKKLVWLLARLLSPVL